MQQIINDLVIKFKKNSKLSMADKELFERELSKEIGKGNYTDEIEAILCEGPIDSTMKVLAKYLSHTDEEVAKSFLKKFIFSKRIKENKGGTSGMRLVPLFSYYRAEKDEQDEIIEKIFIQVVFLSYKSDKNGMNKKVVDEVRKTMVPCILGKDFNLYFINNNTTWEKTRDLFVEVLLQGEKANYVELEKLYSWLSATGNDMGKYSKDFIMDRIMQNEETIQAEKHVPEEKISKKEEQAVQKTSEIQKKDSIDNSGLEKIAAILISNNKEILNLRRDLTSICKKVEQLEFELGKARITELKQEEALRELAEEKMSLARENAAYKSKVDECDRQIASLTREISDQKQFTDTVSRNREKQSEEFINKLSSKLKIDYLDYKDALNLDMTVDLGENMREQLGAVFNILEKNGFKFN